MIHQEFTVFIYRLCSIGTGTVLVLGINMSIGYKYVVKIKI